MAMNSKAAVICLCYNHQEFVVEAMQSVLNQTYDTELIVVDDASKDQSVQKIKDFVNQNPNENIKTLFFSNNVGNCQAFNEAFKLTDADYIIDLAADDMLLPKRVEYGLAALEKDAEVAVNFTNANYIDELGLFVKTHYQVDKSGYSSEIVPEGDLFNRILAYYFICPPTIMFRASFLRNIGGYDPDLAYEDFDVMLRLSRKHPFSYTDKILVEKRILKNSMSINQYKRNNAQLQSTLKICRKAFGMIKNKSEKRSLVKRIAYEAKQAFINKRFLLLFAFINLGIKSVLQK